MKTAEDVGTVVELARADLVEEDHHDKGVEDDGVVDGGQAAQRGRPTIVNIQQALSCRAMGQFKWMCFGSSKCCPETCDIFVLCLP